MGNKTYSANLTGAWFLFYEIKQIAKLIEVHVLQTRLNAQREKLLSIINGNETEKEKSKAKKEIKTIEKQIEEIKDFDEVLHHMADKQIEIDLDEGVAVNYMKFKELLVDIKLKDSEEE